MTFLKIILVLALIVVLRDAYTIYMYARQSDVLIARSQAFQRINSSATTTILFLGDSTAVGTGSASPADSIAARFSAAYPDAQILNEGVIGERVQDLAENFNPDDVLATTSSQKVSLVVIQIGANDVTHFTSLTSVSTDLTALLIKVKTISNNVVLLHGGDVGIAPIIPWYAKPIFRWRTLELRDVYQKVAAAEGVTYVDLMFDGADDTFRSNPGVYFAADGFHPNSAGYAIWFEKIMQSISL